MANNGTILLVEDQNPYLFQELLNAYNGFEFVVVKRGDHVIDEFIRRKPVLILMDVHLPMLDGIEAVKQIRQIDLRTPIIVMTAYTDEETRGRALSAGANDFFPKPFSYKKLYQRMVELSIQAMTMKESGSDDHLETLIQNKTARLNALQEKEALFGINCPTEIILEIKTLQGEIDNLLCQRANKGALL